LGTKIVIKNKAITHQNRFLFAFNGKLGALSEGFKVLGWADINFCVFTNQITS